MRMSSSAISPFRVPRLGRYSSMSSEMSCGPDRDPGWGHRKVGGLNSGNQRSANVQPWMQGFRRLQRSELKTNNFVVSHDLGSSDSYMFPQLIIVPTLVLTTRISRGAVTVFIIKTMNRSKVRSWHFARHRMLGKMVFGGFGCR